MAQPLINTKGNPFDRNDSHEEHFSEKDSEEISPNLSELF
ncbi:hypothetical protein HMPREF1869_01135 [Bacteroidales bacterium KA00251]|nr:hypothetical protein HMPREF1869_01135 [Bacteroidales bacterium KA00251]